MNGHLTPEAAVTDVVEMVQRKLQCLGLYHGACDGRPSVRLQASLQQFVATISDEGPVNPEETWTRLREAGGCSSCEVLLDELRGLRPEAAAVPDELHWATGALENIRQLTEASLLAGDTIHATPKAVPPSLGGALAGAAHNASLAGLAFSGGGVRSATFNLGILQALSQVGMLDRFDYISTVSGGGYIGGWLSRWIKEQKDPAGVIAELAQTAAPHCEPRQVRYLRQYSNYLTPKTGLFSADTWAFLATWMRNAGLNLLILCSGLAVLLILPHLWINAVDAWHTNHAPGFLWVAIAAFLGAVFNIALALSLKPDYAAKKAQGQRWVLTWVVVPLMVAAAAGSVALWEYRGAITGPWAAAQKGGFHWAVLVTGFQRHFPYATENQILLALLVAGPCYFLVWACGWGTAQRRNLRRSRQPGTGFKYERPAAIWRQGFWHFTAATLALAVGTCLVVAALLPLRALEGEPAREYLSHVASFGMPLVLAIFGVTAVLMIGIIGRRYTDQSREWWSRQGAWTIIFVVSWTALFLFAIYSPVALLWAAGWADGPWERGGVVAGWLGSVWASLWAARQPGSAQPGRGRALKWLALCGPPLVAVAVLTGIATVIALWLAQAPAAETSASFVNVLHGQMSATVNASPLKLSIGLAFCAFVCLLFAHRVDVNKFSLYMMYRNRLVRAYLGAIRSHRAPHPFTGFDTNDDIALQDLAPDQAIQRPYHIINTALNLVKGKELAWQTRKAASFVFTPKFCGYETPRMRVSETAEATEEAARGMFRPTRTYGARSADAEKSDQGVKLGMAMAISGAAASPSMGYHSSPALTFLMTLFNVRLGRWCGNPCSRDGWKHASPPWGFRYLFKELFGLTDASSPFLYLSDGGHFENLGIYELVRRRCRLIVAVDASADSDMHFGDLSNAVRKCYTDFNIQIDIDVKEIERMASGFSSKYCAAGRIRYDTGDGILLYIKPCLLGTEFVDIFSFHQENEAFPHQSTVDQWFDETQFESYRALGQRIGTAVFGELARAAGGADAPVPRLCQAIAHNWLAAPRTLPARPARHASARTTRNPTMSLHRPAEKPLRSAERR
jgi:hypothetical protein